MVCAESPLHLSRLWPSLALKLESKLVFRVWFSILKEEALLPPPGSVNSKRWGGRAGTPGAPLFHYFMVKTALWLDASRLYPFLLKLFRCCEHTRWSG